MGSGAKVTQDGIQDLVPSGPAEGLHAHMHNGSASSGCAPQHVGDGAEFRMKTNERLNRHVVPGRMRISIPRLHGGGRVDNLDQR